VAKHKRLSYKNSSDEGITEKQIGIYKIKIIMPLLYEFKPHKKLV
jgi:hypothetical protein